MAGKKALGCLPCLQARAVPRRYQTLTHPDTKPGPGTSCACWWSRWYGSVRVPRVTSPPLLAKPEAERLFSFERAWKISFWGVKRVWGELQQFGGEVRTSGCDELCAPLGAMLWAASLSFMVLFLMGFCCLKE